jgi:hypothetical protein
MGYFYNKNGFEIGGKSEIFSERLLPIYLIAKSIDNCNFASDTLWERHLQEEQNFHYYLDKVGFQFIAEASNLPKIVCASYDFIISSHTLEHSANPIKVLNEWKRILKPKGVMLLLLPHKEGTFDHRRPLTKITHLIEDYQNQIQEDDMTHLSEIIRYHDLGRDIFGGTKEAFIQRAKKNFKNRTIHHHTFITESVINLIDCLSMKIIFVFSYIPDKIIILCQKTSLNLSYCHKYNSFFFLNNNALWRKFSPFKLDKTRFKDY